MLGIAAGSVLVPLNSTMLAVALPSIMGEFSVDAATVSTLVTLYLATVTVALLASGSLGDRFGQRPTFLVGVVAFALASLLAGIAPSFEVLALARILQALTGALVSTSSVALVRMLAPAGRRGSAFGLFDMLVSVSAALGPLIGGLIVGVAGWRALFVMAVPFALFAAVMVGWIVRPAVTAGEAGHADRRRAPIDVRGLVLLALILIAALVAIRSIGTSSTWIVAGAVAAGLLVVFLRLELSEDRPAVDPRLFTDRTFSAAVLGVLGTTVVLHGAFLLVPLLVERLLAQTATMAGLVLLGLSGASAISAPFGGRWSDRVGRRQPVVIGSLVIALGVAGLWGFAVSSAAIVIAVLLAVVGFGMGFAGSPRQAAALEAVPADRIGMGAGTYYTGRYLGGVIGASLAGAVLGTTVTGAGITLGFGLLTIVAFGVVVASLWLPGPRTAAAPSTAPALD